MLDEILASIFAHEATDRVTEAGEAGMNSRRRRRRRLTAAALLVLTVVALVVIVVAV